ncbi:MAG: response regulator, partial [Chloroflexota bacterium]
MPRRSARRSAGGRGEACPAPMASRGGGLTIQPLTLTASRSGTTTGGVVGESVTTTVLFAAAQRPPVSQLRGSSFAAPDRSPLGASPRPAPDGPLVLVVDDDEAILSTVQQILTFGGYRTLLAHDGAEALELVDAEKPELVLLD